MNKNESPGSSGRFKRYPDYKASGVEWLGGLPAQWAVKRLKNCVRRLDSGGTPESDNIAYWTDDETGTPWVAISDMTRAFNVRDTARRLTEKGLRSKRLPVLPAGTLLYSMYASLGKVAMLEIDAVVNQAILGLVTRDELASRDYLRWWLEFMQGHIQMLSSSNTQDNLNAEKVRAMPVFVPASAEQVRIAAFLDRETARIDALVAKNERLIGLLEERRTALITRVVTKGLDQNAPMTPSGVAWFGEIPASWRVKPLKHTIRFLEGPGIMASDFMDAGIPLLRIAGLSGRMATLDGCNFLAPDLVRRKWGHFRVRAGDLLISGSASSGLCAEVDSDTEGAIPYTGIIIIRPRASVTEPTFLRWFLLSAAFQTQVEQVRSGTAIQHFGPTHMSGMNIAIPPVSEQLAIATFLDGEAGRIDTLVAKVRDGIERLNELRAALISAAVTGKIDVREADVA